MADAATRKRKVINECLHNARQLLKWNQNMRSYEAIWTTMKELVAEFGESQAHNMWNKNCLTCECKVFPDFQQPVAQCQALAIWRNEGWSWQESLAWWQRAPKANVDNLVVDQNSRERMRRRLQELFA